MGWLTWGKAAQRPSACGPTWSGERIFVSNGSHHEKSGRLVAPVPARRYIPTMSRELIEDAELIRRMTCGETQALRELYARHGRVVYGMALRILGDQEGAEEITQDVFLEGMGEGRHLSP